MTKFANELTVGECFESLEFTVTPEFNEQYLYAQEDYDPRYLSGTHGPGEVHPTLLLSMSAQTKSPGFRLAPGTGSVLGEQTCRFFQPARVGSRLRVDWRVVNIYEKRGRTYQVIECVLTAEDGATILSRQSHITYPAQRSAAV